MKAHEPYQPRNRRNIILLIAVTAFTLAVAAMWYFRNRLSISIGDMLIMSGAALFIILMTVVNTAKQKELYNNARQLCEQREKMETDDFSDAAIFFRD